MAEQTYISLGGGLRLVEEDYYLGAFGEGISRKGFRLWCEYVGIRMVEIGTTRYVNPFAIEITLAGLMHHSCPHRLIRFPGSLSATKSGVQATRLTDAERALIQWDEVVRDLVKWRKLNGAEVTSETRQQLRDYAKTLRMSALSHTPHQPTSTQRGGCEDATE